MSNWRAYDDDGLWRFYKDGIELDWDISGHTIIDTLNAAEARIAELESISKADNDRLIEAGLSVNLYSGCDTAETMAGMILQYRARIAELEAAQRWIPVSERLPDAYEKVIALAKDCMNVDWVLPKELREVGKGAFARLYNVTHWMPLPTPPEVK